MARYPRPVPERLAEKLYLIRLRLKVTQEKMVELLQSKLREHYQSAPLYPGHISGYEKGKREPSLVVLLAYARIADVPLEVLADDGQSLPGFYFPYEIEKDRRERRKEANKIKQSKKLGSTAKRANAKSKEGKPK